MFYVYELIDPRDLSVFYVGKGQGNRVSQHVRDVRAGRVDNVEKYRRIKEIHAAGLNVVERIASRHETEAQAFAAERVAIASLRAGLTNIVGGTTSNAEANVERARAALARTKPFDEWERTISPYKRQAVEAASGSMRAFYDDHCAFFKRVAEAST